jgi:hypothetical protein
METNETRLRPVASGQRMQLICTGNHDVLVGKEGGTQKDKGQNNPN